MKKFILVYIAALALQTTYAQAPYTFIGELLYSPRKLDFPGIFLLKEIEYPPFSLLNEKYYLKIFFKNGKDSLPCNLYPKEDYYTGQDKQRVEVRITAGEKVIPAQGLEVVAKFYRRPGGTLYGESSYFKLVRHVPHTTAYINSSTFKLSEKINIGAPAIVGLDLMLTWLQRKMHNYGNDDFGAIVNQLEIYTAASGGPCLTDSVLLKQFYALYAFIDPYIQENAFINAEARELNGEIQELKQHPPAPGTPESEGPGIATMDALYNNYLRFADTLKLYHRELSALLFSKKACAETNNTPANMRCYKPYKISFGAGPSVFFFYNDTFFLRHPSRRVLPALSAGIKLRIAGRRRMEKVNRSLPPGKKPKVPGGFTTGIFLNYYIPIPGHKLLIGNLGPGIVLGYSGNKLGVFANLGFKKDISVSFNKWNPAIGVSLTFAFGELAGGVLNKVAGNQGVVQYKADD